MSGLRVNQALVADQVLLDARLGLFHQEERWLAVADLHFGYELSQRAAGWLMPMWGMASIRERLLELVEEYRPRHLVILGDLVHDGTAAAEAKALLEKIQQLCETVVIAGNHDRQISSAFALRASWETEHFHFHHGHCSVEPSHRIQIIGHHHPAGAITDGAGLRLKCPAFVQDQNCWIMPAFSPWSSGTTWRPEGPATMWLCTPNRILRFSKNEVAV